MNAYAGSMLSRMGCPDSPSPQDSSVPDYMLHVVRKDLTTFQRLNDESLLSWPHVMNGLRLISSW